ncbi:MAG: nuclear transport factor 2 family protein [Cyanobacteria bacterium P01_H01_bin.15]
MQKQFVVGQVLRLTASWRRRLGLFGAALLVATTLTPATAQTTAPAELSIAIQTLETAANSRDLETLLTTYAPDFQTTDGLQRAAYLEALSQLWERYPELTYDVELLNWEATPEGWRIETQTSVTGSTADSPPTQLTSTIRSQQTFANGQIQQQKILAEETRRSRGEKPPTLKINLPESASPNSEFPFDVIVNEPRGKQVLLGGVREDVVAAERFLTPTNLPLTVLPAGGIFKVVELSDEPGDRWFSAIVVRNDGMSQITRRVRVE